MVPPGQHLRAWLLLSTRHWGPGGSEAVMGQGRVRASGFLPSPSLPGAAHVMGTFAVEAPAGGAGGSRRGARVGACSSAALT